MTGFIRPRTCGVLIFATALAVVPADNAQAQYVCGLLDAGGAPAGSEGSHSNGAPGSSFENFACGIRSQADGGDVGFTSNVAMGINASARGNGGFNVAVGNGVEANGDRGRNYAAGFNARANGLFGRNLAIGEQANASGTDSRNLASGSEADARGDDSFNLAQGARANASGDDSSNIAIGDGADARGDGSQNVATGTGAKASGDGGRNFAAGVNANASGSGGRNIAIGELANAEGASSANVAIGYDSAASGNSVALGFSSSAQFANSAAFGTDAKAIRNHQQVFGTETNTYTMAGIASNDSRAAQSAPTHFVTTNATGDLAAHTAADLGLATAGDLTTINNQLHNFNTQISHLGGQTELALAGVAMAFAMAGTPALEADENFAVSVNLGHYEGHNATSLGAALRLTDSVQMSGSAAYSDTQDSLGGRVGVRFGW